MHVVSVTKWLRVVRLPSQMFRAHDTHTTTLRVIRRSGGRGQQRRDDVDGSRDDQTRPTQMSRLVRPAGLLGPPATRITIGTPPGTIRGPTEFAPPGSGPGVTWCRRHTLALGGGRMSCHVAQSLCVGSPALVGHSVQRSPRARRAIWWSQRVFAGFAG